MQETSRQGREAVEEREGVREDNGPFDRGKNFSPSEKSATEFFVAPTYRHGQREVLEKVEDAFLSGYRYVIVEAPTGIGKSHIARALAFKYGCSFILTIQKGLQSQYQADFPDMYVMKGRSAYPCKEKGKTCDQGPCRRKKRRLHPDCAYSRALLAAMTSPVVVHNFDSFYYQSMRTDFGYRELMVIDEAHNIESKFLGFMEFSISNRGDPALIIPEYDEMYEYDNFLETRLQVAREELEQLDGSDMPEDMIIKEMDELTSLVGRLEKYMEWKENGVEYVFDYESDKYQKLTVRPVMVGDFVSSYLLSKVKRVLMMSATILDRDIFCNSIGIDPGQCKFFRMKSIFPAKNRPVYLDAPVGSMNKDTIKDTLPEIVKEIQRLMNTFPNIRGIIQTHTLDIMKYIKENMTDFRLTYRSDYMTVDDMLKAHAEKAASFLVVAGQREGLDLKDDLSRVQIICKVPWPNLADKRVKRRMELDPQWSTYMTALMFVQMLGRSVRSETDKAKTFVLDSDFIKFYRMGGLRLLPLYIQEALIW